MGTVPGILLPLNVSAHSRNTYFITSRSRSIALWTVWKKFQLDMARFEEGISDLDGGVVAVDRGVEGDDAGGYQVRLVGYGSIQVYPLPLVLVVIGSRRGAE